MLITLRDLTSLIVALTLQGCQTPFLVFPGKALVGIESSTKSFGFAKDYRFLVLEVQGPHAYSVNLRITVIDDELYIDAAKGRKWGRYLEENRQVRIGIAGHVYSARAVTVVDPGITRKFMEGRTIYRLQPP